MTLKPKHIDVVELDTTHPNHSLASSFPARDGVRPYLKAIFPSRNVRHDWIAWGGVEGGSLEGRAGAGSFWQGGRTALSRAGVEPLWVVGLFRRCGVLGLGFSLGGPVKGDTLRYVMDVQKSRPRKSIEDYMRLPDDVRVELIQGEFYMSPSPSVRHQEIVGALYRAIHDHVTREESGKVFIAPLDVVLPSGDVVQPDIVFVASSRSDIIRERIRGVPDLVIEVLSPEGAERDRIVKRSVFLANGVPEYWIVDPETETVEVFRLIDGDYQPQGYFERGHVVYSPALDLSVAVQTVFE